MIELTISSLLLLLLVLFLNPFQLWMPSEMHMMLIVLLILIFAVFVLFVFKEKVRDEREVLHRYIANRYAYLAGTTILVLGISWQYFKHDVDIWLILSLMVMIFAKIIGLLWSKLKN